MNKNKIFAESKSLISAFSIESTNLDSWRYDALSFLKNNFSENYNLLSQRIEYISKEYPTGRSELINKEILSNLKDCQTKIMQSSL